MRRFLVVSALILGLALAPEAFGQAPSAYKTRLDEIVKAQEQGFKSTTRS